MIANNFKDFVIRKDAMLFEQIALLIMVYNSCIFEVVGCGT